MFRSTNVCRSPNMHLQICTSSNMHLQSNTWSMFTLFCQLFSTFNSCHVRTRRHACECVLYVIQHSGGLHEMTRMMVEKDCDAAIWLGDMNWISDETERDDMHLPDGWSDLWRETIPPETPGFTFHANQGSTHAMPARLDRILTRGLQISGSYVARLGTVKISGANSFPSDHYGLFAICSI